MAAPWADVFDSNHGPTASLMRTAGPGRCFHRPVAMTPGCTTQSCLLRDISGDVGDTAILGISPDAPDRQKRFDDEHGLGFPLLSDPEHKVAEKYGVWVLKKNYGREYMGVQRSAFLVGADGKIERSWPKISPKDTPTKLLDALEA